jgi:hypothetical protein
VTKVNPKKSKDDSPASALQGLNSSARCIAVFRRDCR